MVMMEMMMRMLMLMVMVMYLLLADGSNFVKSVKSAAARCAQGGRHKERIKTWIIVIIFIIMDDIINIINVTNINCHLHHHV